MFYDMTYVFEGLFWLLCRKKKKIGEQGQKPGE